jgi:hypothetical protein
MVPALSKQALQLVAKKEQG